MASITTTNNTIEVPSDETKRVSLCTASKREMRELLHEMSVGRVGIICNTVANAVLIYEEIRVNAPEHWDVTLYHARYATGERSRKTQHILSSVGKEESNLEKLYVVVGTQVLEQSLDLDFDAMFTENAPIDLLFQRMGRLHRHAHRQERPGAARDPVLRVFQEGELNDAGSRYIYGDYLLESSKQILQMRDEVLLPYDIGLLVSQVYDEGMDNSLYEMFKLSNDGLASKTSGFRVPNPGINNLYNWVTVGGDAPSDIAGEAKVRQGDSGISVILLFETTEGYEYIDSKGTRQSLPSHPPAFWEAREIRGSTVALPAYALRGLKDWENVIHALEFRAQESGILGLWEGTPLEGELPILMEDGMLDMGSSDVTISYSDIGLDLVRDNGSRQV